MKRCPFLLSIVILSFISLFGCKDDKAEPETKDNNEQTGDTVKIGAVWHFYGDSQTSGRADESTATSHAIAFKNIWLANHDQVSIEISGVGGCTILNSLDRYLGNDNLSAVSFVHFQESGDQNKPGQQTAQEFGENFEKFVREIISNSPNAVISTETAYSFQREDVEFRDWGPYNIVLKNKISELNNEGIKIYLADVDTYIKLLVEELGFANVITDDGGHYKGVGNLLVALSIYKSLGYDVEKLDLSNIPDSEISQTQKTLCINILNESK